MYQNKSKLIGWIIGKKNHIKPIAQHDLKQVRRIITTTDKKMTALIHQMQASPKPISEQAIAEVFTKEFTLKGVPDIYKKMLAHSLGQMLLVS
ncbi:hypothetical protein BGC07_00325 [Piscirickettsia litoralis]|uniref:Uncharacterized protein n=1 Tax=Piscirickettsia litoralis TaxID=1891921 RepID=A0ABX2ZYL5_9GAMM|nr:hypothetical protein BGC07_00325 [Piscirickettsia litoralis]